MNYRAPVFRAIVEERCRRADVALRRTRKVPRTVLSERALAYMALGVLQVQEDQDKENKDPSDEGFGHIMRAIETFQMLEIPENEVLAWNNLGQFRWQTREDADGVQKAFRHALEVLEGVDHGNPSTMEFVWNQRAKSFVGLALSSDAKPTPRIDRFCCDGYCGARPSDEKITDFLQIIDDAVKCARHPCLAKDMDSATTVLALAADYHTSVDVAETCTREAISRLPPTTTSSAEFKLRLGIIFADERHDCRSAETPLAEAVTILRKNVDDPRVRFLFVVALRKLGGVLLDGGDSSSASRAFQEARDHLTPAMDATGLRQRLDYDLATVSARKKGRRKARREARVHRSLRFAVGDPVVIPTNDASWVPGVVTKLWPLDEHSHSAPPYLVHLYDDASECYVLDDDDASIRLYHASIHN